MMDYLHVEERKLSLNRGNVIKNKCPPPKWSNATLEKKKNKCEQRTLDSMKVKFANEKKKKAIPTEPEENREKLSEERVNQTIDMLCKIERKMEDR